MKSKTTIHIKIHYKEDLSLLENDITEFIDGTRERLSKSLDLPMDNVQVMKIIQETPLWSENDDEEIAEA